MCESAEGVSTAAMRQWAGTAGAAFTDSAAVIVTFGSETARRSSHELPDSAPSNASMAIISAASGPAKAGRYIRRTLLTHEIRGVVHAAGPFVCRELRVRTERACHVDTAVGDVIRGHGVGRGIVLPPSLHHRHVVHLVRPGSVAAVLHAGSHEQPYPVVLLSSHFLQHVVVVVDRVAGGDRRVVPPVIQQKLSAVRFER